MVLGFPEAMLVYKKILPIEGGASFHYTETLKIVSILIPQSLGA